MEGTVFLHNYGSVLHVYSRLTCTCTGIAIHVLVLPNAWIVSVVVWCLCAGDVGAHMAWSRSVPWCAVRCSAGIRGLYYGLRAVKLYVHVCVPEICTPH